MMATPRNSPHVLAGEVGLIGFGEVEFSGTALVPLAETEERGNQRDTRGQGKAG